MNMTRQKKKQAMWLESTFPERKSGGFNDRTMVGKNKGHLPPHLTHDNPNMIVLSSSTSLHSCSDI
jgi:hypothetical protein